ncbi:hypothetical protein PybrP1_008726 [[Pythium] brassicae (nom. inval.)]|nr:hypothetical protein PybrP1_008726 [[Pythium] brassicae (nom. inval.)]
MDSFGFDFPGGDLLDLGSLGMWGGGSTPLGSSPNGGGGGGGGGGNGGLPFSVGTPTGVQSLGDEPFASLAGGADDFNFGDSPRASPGARKADDLASPYFGSELDPGGAEPSGSENKAGNGAKADDAAGKDPAQRKGGGLDGGAAPPGSSASNPSGAAGFLMAEQGNNLPGPRPGGAFQGGAVKPSAAAASAAAARNAASAPGSALSSAAATGATAPASTNASSARPHIDGPGSAAPSPSGRPGGMQPGQQGFVAQGYQLNAQGNPVLNGQYMQPQYRAPTSTYDEEFMRVKAMMMQHPDLIPPPMEVLRISMSQSAPAPGMLGPGMNYMQQRPGQVMNRVGVGAAGYPQYGAPNPNMMMAPQAPAGMDANRMRAMQMGQQAPPLQAQQQQPPQPQRPIPQGARTPGGSASGSPDSQAAWQSENDLPLRRKMIGKIVSLLQQRKPDAPAEWIRRLPDMARRLEDSLYRTAKNRDEYGDFSSLKTRLQHLAVTMGARAQHKAGGNPRAAPGGAMPNGAGNAMAGSAMPPMAVNPATMGGAGGMAPQGHVANMQYANQQMNQRGQNANFMQQQQQAQNAQLQQRASMNGGGRMSADLGMGAGLGAESADFLNLDLSLGDSDLSVDASSLGGGNPPGAGDAAKSAGGGSDAPVTGMKRTLSQSQQQMAAAANAAAFKRTKAGGAAGGGTAAALTNRNVYQLRSLPLPLASSGR